MKPSKTLLGPIALGIALTAAMPASAAIDIVFDYTHDTNGFFDAGKKSLMEQAAQVFEARILDTLTGFSSGGSNHFDAGFTNPGTGLATTLSDYSIAAGRIDIFLGGRNLGGGTLGLASTSYNVGGFANFVNNSVSRGQAGALSNPASDYGPWGGSIAFSNTSSWYVDADPSTKEAFSGFDLYSVALHEIGHLLGVGIADSWDAHRSGLSFNGPASKAANGGNAVALADDGHWKEGTLSKFGLTVQEAVMTPTIAAGERQYFTELDWAALTDIGWQIAPVPEPETYAMMLLGLGLIGIAARRRRGR